MQDTQQATQTQSRRGPSLSKAHRLKSISVVGGFLDGVRLDLADGLNCIIGARGTGKTTALELLRYVIAAMPNRETHPGEYKRIESLVQQNLAGGRVEVEVETKDGLHYTISRTWGEGADPPQFISILVKGDPARSLRGWPCRPHTFAWEALSKPPTQ